MHHDRLALLVRNFNLRFSKHKALMKCLNISGLVEADTILLFFGVFTQLSRNWAAGTSATFIIKPNIQLINVM